MQYTINHGEKGRVEIKVDIPKATFETAYNQILVKLGHDAKIDGFRPGKAPADVVEGKVGLNKILNETASSSISKHLSDILEKEKLIPLESPKIAVNTLAKSSPFSFTASFTQKPKVKVGSWKTIKVKKVAAKEVTEKDIDESIKNIYEAWVKQQETRNKKQETKDEESQVSQKFIYDAHGNKVFFEDKKTLRSSSNQDSTLDALKAKWRSQAEKNVKISLILEQIGQDEKVQVLPSEVEQALKGVNATNLTEDQKRDLERYLAVSIFQAKTLDLVKKAVAF